MREISHWVEGRSLRVAESASGVLVTEHPLDNLVRGSTKPWPTPELLQKFYKGIRFRGRTEQDQTAAESGLGYYCDLQSLNSEDAITWSVFGTLAYETPKIRLDSFNCILRALGEAPVDDAPIVWLWRRLPHPEKPESNGGPEIDFGFLCESTLLLGEAKWNSALGAGQGVNGDKSQLDLRRLYCSGIAPRALRSVRRLLILGVGRTTGSVFGTAGTNCDADVRVRELTWEEICRCLSVPNTAEIARYLKWKAANGTS